TVVVDLDGGVYSTDDVERELAAVWPPPVDAERLPGPEPTRDTANVEGFEASQAQRLPSLARGELQRQDTHADQVAAVDALVALGDHRADAQQRGALGRPVARAAHPVILASYPDQRHAFGLVCHRG